MASPVVTAIQYTFITVDILSNSLTDFFDHQILAKLYVFVIQDLCLVLSLITLLLFYFNIDALKTGTLGLLLRRFWSAPLLSVVYIILTIVHQILHLRLHWNEYSKRKPVDGLLWKSQISIVAIFIIQRLFSAFYYFSFIFTLRKLQSNQLINKLDQ